MTLTFWPAGNPALQMQRRFRSVFAGLALAVPLLLLSATPAGADELKDANQLLRQGQHAQALDKINQYLASKPRDAQGRFLKGLILTEQSKNAEAIDVFTRLTQDYPELPEPYNNLAVLYAAQGQYERARQSLEQSIRTHPSYATAYENLGDVYTKLASQAYDKALQLDSSNSTAKTKLSLVRDLIVGTPRPVKPALPSRVEIARVEPPPAKPPAAPKPAAIARAEIAKTEAPKADRPRADTKPEAKAAAAAPVGNDDVLKAVKAWAQAWASKDVKGYLSYYARDFKTPKGESRADWEKERTQRIQAPKEISVGVESPRITISGDTATVNYRQFYRSDRLRVSSNKTLVMVRSNGRWLIQQERSGS